MRTGESPVDDRYHADMLLLNLQNCGYHKFTSRYVARIHSILEEFVEHKNN